MLLSPLVLISLEFFVYICTPFLIGLFGFLESNLLSSLSILDICPLSDVQLVKIFSQSVGCLLVLLKVSFALQKLCNFMRSICQFLILQHKPLVFYSRTFPLCSCARGSSPLYFLLVSVYLVEFCT